MSRELKWKIEERAGMLPPVHLCSLTGKKMRVYKSRYKFSNSGVPTYPLRVD